MIKQKQRISYGLYRTIYIIFGDQGTDWEKIMFDLTECEGFHAVHWLGRGENGNDVQNTMLVISTKDITKEWEIKQRG